MLRATNAGRGLRFPSPHPLMKVLNIGSRGTRRSVAEEVSLLEFLGYDGALPRRVNDVEIRISSEVLRRRMCRSPDLARNWFARNRADRERGWGITATFSTTPPPSAPLPQSLPPKKMAEVPRKQRWGREGRRRERESGVQFLRDFNLSAADLTFHLL